MVPLGPGPAGHRLYALPDIAGAGRQDPLSPVPAAGRNETKPRCSTLPGPKRPAAARRGGAIPHPATSGKERGAPGVLTRCQQTPRRVSKKPKPRSAERGSFQPPRRASPPLLSRSCRSPCTAPAPPNPRSPCAGSPASRRGPAGRAPSSRPPPRRAPRSPWPDRAGQNGRSAAAPLRPHGPVAAPPPHLRGRGLPPGRAAATARRRRRLASLLLTVSGEGERAAGLGSAAEAGPGPRASPPRQPPGSSPRGREPPGSCEEPPRRGAEGRGFAVLSPKDGATALARLQSGCGAAMPADGRSEARPGAAGRPAGGRRPSVLHPALGGTAWLGGTDWKGTARCWLKANVLYATVIQMT